MAIFACLSDSCNYYEDCIAGIQPSKVCPECKGDLIYIRQPTDIAIVSFKSARSRLDACRIMEGFSFNRIVPISLIENIDRLPLMIYSRVDRETAQDIRIRLERSGVGVRLSDSMLSSAKDQQLKKRVLIVEDSPAVRKQLKELLESRGYIICEAADGFDALSKLKKADNIDIIISDINMPKLDGLKFINMINRNEKYRNIPIIMLTTRNVSEDILKAMRIGVRGYLIKPVSRRVLLKKMEEVLALI